MLVSCLAVLLLSGTALAEGRVVWKSKTFKERSDKAWMIEVAIYLPRAPDVAYVPMKFEFELTTYFERALIDGHDGPVENNTPITGRQPLIETVDVGFMDNSTAKIEKRTRFSFKIKRDLGYEAGVYKVTIRDTRNGHVVGSPTSITFDGQNEVIDRRSIVFQGDEGKKKKKKDAAKDDGGDKKADSASSDGGDDKSAGSSDEGSDDASGDDESDEGSDNSGNDDPGPVEHKSSCGCRVPGAPGGPGSTGFLALGLLALFVVRRRPS